MQTGEGKTRLTYKELMSPAYVSVVFEDRKELFCRMYESLFGPLVYFADQLLRDKGQAEDVVASVFVRLYKRLDNEYGSPGHYKAFLYISVRNQCLNAKRHFKVREVYRRYVLGHHSELEEPAITRHMIKSEVMAFILNWMEEGLPADRRKVFKLAYIDGLNNEELAAHFGRSVSTIKTQKARAILALRKAFSESELA